MKMYTAKKPLLIVSLLIAVIAFPVSAFAFSGVSPIQTMDGSAEFSAFYTSGLDIDYEVELEFDESGDVGIERDVLGVSIVSGGDMMNLYLSLGFIMDGEYSVENMGMGGMDEEDEADWDKGAMLILGGRGMVADLDPVTLHVYGQVGVSYNNWEGEGSYSVLHIEETSGGTPGEIPATTEYEVETPYNETVEILAYDFSIGLAGQYEVSDALAFYGALELTPLSGGTGTVEIESFDELAYTRGEEGVDFESVERKDLVTFKMGGMWKMESLFVRGELSFGAEQAFTLNTGLFF